MNRKCNRQKILFEYQQEANKKLSFISKVYHFNHFQTHLEMRINRAKKKFSSDWRLEIILTILKMSNLAFVILGMWIWLGEDGCEWNKGSESFIACVWGGFHHEGECISPAHRRSHDDWSVQFQFFYELLQKLGMCVLAVQWRLLAFSPTWERNYKIDQKNILTSYVKLDTFVRNWHSRNPANDSCLSFTDTGHELID